MIRCFVLAVSASLALAGCQVKEEKTGGPSPVRVKVMKVALSEQKTSGRFSGTVEEAAGTPLSFSVMGTVNAVSFRLGDRVEKGQLLASLDATSVRSSYDAAKAALVQAEDAYRRMKELHGKGSLPEIKWVEVQSKLQQARSMEEMARKNLKDCKLYAPFSGVIADKSVEVGQNVIPGMAVGKLLGVSRLKVKISMPESEIASVSLHQKAEIVVPALGSRRFSGMVTEVRLAGADGGTAVIVPARIVQLDEKNRSFVWIDNNGVAEKRVISCGDFAGDGVLITSGLKVDDRIIVEGQQKVCNGTKITADEEAKQ